MRSRGLSWVAFVVLAAALAWVCWLPRFGLSAAAYLAGVSVAALAFLVLVQVARRGGGPDEGRAGLLFRPPGLLLGALLLRLVVIGAEPYLSDDVHRYLWEGAVQRAGYSPYAHAPDAEVLAHLQDENHARVNHPDVPAAYPPGIQLLFRVLAPSIPVWKAVLLAADLGLLLLLLHWLRQRERPPAHAAWFAFHPLVVIEFAGTGHLDLLAMFAVVAALAWLRRPLLAAAFAAAAVLVKPPGLAAAVPLLQQRRWLACGLVVILIAAAFLPFAGSGAALLDGVREYERHWEFNGLLHAPLRMALQQAKTGLESLDSDAGWTTPFRELGYWLQPNLHARRLTSGLFLALAVLVLVRLRDDPRRTVLGLLLAYLVTSPTVYSWYVAWLVPFGVLVPSAAIATLSLTALVSSVVKVTELTTGTWIEPGWVRCVHWVPACLVGARELWRRSP